MWKAPAETNNRRTEKERDNDRKVKRRRERRKEREKRNRGYKDALTRRTNVRFAKLGGIVAVAVAASNVLRQRHHHRPRTGVPR